MCRTRAARRQRSCIDAPSKTKAVYLADHCIPGNGATQFHGDLTGAQPLRPQLLQEFNALRCPAISDCVHQDLQKIEPTPVENGIGDR